MLKVDDIKEGDLLRCVEGRTAAVVDDTGRLSFLPTFLTLGELESSGSTMMHHHGPGHCGFMMYLGKSRDQAGKRWYEMLWNQSVLHVRGIDIRYLEKMLSR
jgi:hypothetical protein